MAVFFKVSKCIRPWQHVLEPIYGYLKLMHICAHLMEVIMLQHGTLVENIKTVEWITKKLVSICNSKSLIKHETEKKLHEANILKLDVNNEILNWHHS